MRALTFLVLFVHPLSAAEPLKTNSLSQKDITEGWLMLFDGETAFGWKLEGRAEVKNGELILGKGQKSKAYPTPLLGGRFEVQFEWLGTGKVYLRELASDTAVLLAPDPTRPDVWGRVQYKRDLALSSLDGHIGGKSSSVHRIPDAPKELQDRPFVIETDGASELRLRNVRVRPLGLKDLFNGRNLEGWKVLADPKRNASRWMVTSEGWLNVKNGPGDLQTERKFGDFVLQLECISHGKALNSGIFFRCMPDRYQDGYEAQIQNGYNDSDRTKPADFGTGGIYRRIAARKVVPNDQEWFTLTVAARDRHIATWVNGYATVDWIDERKDNDNPRQGFRAAPGHISIQGHDPTTNLSFRNIRIVEMK